MRLTPDKLNAHLKNPLQRIYLISGDEPMQQLEAADEIRQVAKTQGIEEREIIFVDSKFSWESLLEQGGTMSLFAERRMLDIRIEKFPLRNDQKIFLDFLDRVDESLVVLLTTPKLDSKVQKQKWAQLIAKKHVWLPVWPIAIDALPQWLIKKAQQRDRKLDNNAAVFLANQVEGNLLAAKQELDKACLISEAGEIISQQLLAEQVSDNARFTAWELLDVVFKGGSIVDKQKIPRILLRLKQEKTEPMLLAKSLQRDCLALEKMSAQIETGKSQSAVFQEYRIWAPRQAIMGAAVKRYRSNAWQRLWVRALILEKIIIGQTPGNFWDQCLELCLLISAQPIWSSTKQKKAPLDSQQQLQKLRQTLSNQNNTDTGKNHASQ